MLHWSISGRRGQIEAWQGRVLGALFPWIACLQLMNHLKVFADAVHDYEALGSMTEERYRADTDQAKAQRLVWCSQQLGDIEAASHPFRSLDQPALSELLSKAKRLTEGSGGLHVGVALPKLTDAMHRLKSRYAGGTDGSQWTVTPGVSFANLVAQCEHSLMSIPIEDFVQQIEEVDDVATDVSLVVY